MSLVDGFLSRTSSTMLKYSSSSGPTTNLLKSAVIASVVSMGSLIAINLRWKYFMPALLGTSKPRKLPITEKKAQNAKSIAIVLLHGMWHDAAYFAELQTLLAKQGYTTYAIDLLPGERLTPGGSQTELVNDLELTLRGIKETYILFGHSQGGLLVQACLQRSDEIRKAVAGVILSATFPFGKTPPFKVLASQKRNMIVDWGYLWVCLFGKLVNARYTKDIFLLPTTNDETSPGIFKYIQGCLQAPSDGRITTTHFPFKTKPMSTPCLILSAADDIIYPPQLLEQDFRERFPKAKHITIPNQAHCFMDPNWQTTFVKPLVSWLDEQAEDNFIL